jgi:hypothetical protein
MTNNQIEELKNDLIDKDNTLAIKNKELAQSKNRLIKLNEFVKVARELKKDEIFYIATTELYAKNNRFEYGGVANVNDLPGRLATYNTGRAEGDLYYYCKIIKVHKYKHIENCLDTSHLANLTDEEKMQLFRIARKREKWLVDRAFKVLGRNHRHLFFLLYGTGPIHSWCIPYHKSSNHKW